MAPGTRLGPYDILSALGAGGMGEIWRARDTRLNRLVAIKTSPQRHFAFGVVLYELIAGTRLFTGETQANLVASIPKDEPRPLFELEPRTPRGIAEVVRTCLEKDAEKRRPRAPSGAGPERKTEDSPYGMPGDLWTLDLFQRPAHASALPSELRASHPPVHSRRPALSGALSHAQRAAQPSISVVAQLAHVVEMVEGPRS